MAVVSNSQDDLNNQQTGQQGNGSSSAPVSVASASGGSGTSGSSTPSSSSGSAPAGTSGNTANTSSGGFTNLKSYLNANSGYNGGQGFGAEVNSNLQNQAQTVNSNINNASNDFTNQTVNSVAPVTQNYNSFESGTGNGSDLNAIQNYAGNSQNVQNTQNLENASYTGPTSLNDLTGADNGNALQSQVNNYGSLVQNTNSAAGRTNLLQNLYGQSGYNAGQQTLDNAFLQGTNFAPAQAAANQLGNTFNQASNNATAQGQAAGQQVQQYANNVTGQLNNAEGNLYSGVNNTYNTNLSNQANTVAAQQQALENYNVGQGEATGLGLTQGQDIYNAVNSGNVGNYVTANNAYGVQDAATTQQLAQNQALANLLGTNANNTSQSYINNLNAANTGGLVNYNATALANAIGAGQSDYNTQGAQDASTVNTLGNDNTALYGQFGVQNGGGVNFGNQTVNQALGLSNPLNQNLSALLGGSNSIGQAEGPMTAGLTNQQAVSNLAQDNDDVTGKGQLQAYFAALNNLANLQNTYGANNNLNISGA